MRQTLSGLSGVLLASSACLSPQPRSPETVPTAAPEAIPPTMAGMITVVKKAA